MDKKTKNKRRGRVSSLGREENSYYFLPSHFPLFKGETGEEGVKSLIGIGGGGRESTFD